MNEKIYPIVVMLVMMVWIYLAAKKHKSVILGMKSREVFKKENIEKVKEHCDQKGADVFKRIYTEYQARLCGFWILLAVPFAVLASFASLKTSPLEFVCACAGIAVCSIGFCALIHPKADPEFEELMSEFSEK